ncbi:hypothetical protein D9M69_581090 [compost metagenome]
MADVDAFFTQGLPQTASLVFEISCILPSKHGCGHGFAPECEQHFRKRVLALPFLPSPEQEREFRMLYQGHKAASGGCIPTEGWKIGRPKADFKSYEWEVLQHLTSINVRSRKINYADSTEILYVLDRIA